MLSLVEMYRLFFLAIFSFARLSGFFAQCGLSGLSSTYCVNSPSSALLSSPAGGVLSGAGLINDVFFPSMAGVGQHTLQYVNCSMDYTMEADAFVAHSYTPQYIWFGDNDVTNALPIGFKFRYFCETYDSLYLSSNGFLTFTPPANSGCCQGLSLPNTNAPANMVAFAWTDLDPSQGGTVRYCTVGTAPNRIMVVSFNCVFHKTGNGPVTSEVYLYESSNLIEISTVTKPIPSGTVMYNTTMGITGPGGQAYVVPGRNGNASWTATNELYRFIPGPYCEATASTVVWPVPTVSAGVSETLVCKGEPVQLQAGGAVSYTWSSGLTGSSVTEYPQSNALFTVTASDQQGCSSTATVFVSVSSCNGIGEMPSTSLLGFSVFPNPSDGNLRIRLEKAIHLQLLNSQGILVRDVEVFDAMVGEVRLDDLPAGLYFIGEKGGKVYQKLLVLEGR